jgi:hypothetical protein
MTDGAHREFHKRLVLQMRGCAKSSHTIDIWVGRTRSEMRPYDEKENVSSSE